jgi:hypothetical protein
VNRCSGDAHYRDGHRRQGPEPCQAPATERVAGLWYCAQHAHKARLAVEGDPLAAQWCCLSCGATFAIGKAFTRGGIGERPAGNEHGLNCPNCRGMNIHPADGAVVTLNAYHGERGTLQ